MMGYEEHILTPFEIKNVSLTNRLVVAPMTRVSATEGGTVTPAMAQYYERFAKGGFGLVITEGLYTDQQHSQGYPYQPGISDDEQARGWRTVTDHIHAQRGAVFAQLMHAGALSQGNRFVESTLAPSAVRPKGAQMKFYYGDGPYPVPQAMTDEHIASAISGFANAAKRAIRTSGFDGVEIHGANGYLLDQFLTDHTNLRTDRWGGDVQARLRLSLEVIRAVKHAVGSAPVGIRISQSKVNDPAHRWTGGERDAEHIFGALADAGVDFIHVTEHEAWQPAFASGSVSLIELCRRYAPRVTLIANGGLGDPEHASQVVAGGADLIALGKPALANPDYPLRLRSQLTMDDFDPSILGPIANIKPGELQGN